MAGIYLHIPYCRQACSYCDFHFVTSLKHKNDFVGALISEIYLRKDFFSPESPDLAHQRNPLSTLYFGGGTPSLLTSEDIREILRALKENFNFWEEAEITLEGNPDDLSPTKLGELRSAGINRLSIGIQSFRDEDLRLLNRSHDAESAKRVIKNAQNAGFNNLTLDLIYGIPGLNMKSWEENVNRAIDTGVPHISAYTLTVEPKTLLHHQVEKKHITLPAEEEVAAQYFRMIEWLKMAGIEQYELSNFALPGYESIHNSSYWQEKPYLGLGPSAHSFSGNRRSWNISNNASYLRALEAKELPEAGFEILSQNDRANERLLTRLRLREGINISDFQNDFGIDLINKEAIVIQLWIKNDWAELSKTHLKLSPAGLILSNSLIGELFT